MADILGTTVSAISHQFRILRGHGLVSSRRDAQTIYYSLTKQAGQQLRRYWRLP
jgi:DNA-binding transcriptional ArsR family regulator